MLWDRTFNSLGVSVKNSFEFANLDIKNLIQTSKQKGRREAELSLNIYNDNAFLPLPKWKSQLVVDWKPPKLLENSFETKPRLNVTTFPIKWKRLQRSKITKILKEFSAERLWCQTQKHWKWSFKPQDSKSLFRIYDNFGKSNF